LQPPKQEKPASTRPSLMSASDTSRQEEVRILNSISDGKQNARAAAAGSHKKPKRTVALVVGLLFLLGVGAAALYAASALHDSATAATEVKPIPPLASAVTPVAPPDTAVINAGPSAQPADGGAQVTNTSPAVQGQGAVASSVGNGDTAVVTDSGAGVQAAPKGDQLTNALEEGVKPPPAALKKALEAKPEKTHRQVTVEEKKKKPTARTEPRNDADVDVIKALVGRSAEVEKKRSAKESKPAGNHQKLAQNADTQAKSSDGRNVDIVQRTPGESTESLLNRCKSLGFLEGEFCRWRICSGRWDTDAACKVPNSN